MITFRNITIEGFGSIIKPLRYNLNQPGINVITAKNGIGKTTIFSALFWALYGKPLKKGSQIKTWKDLRPGDYKGVRVSVKFIKDLIPYEVIAHEDYKGMKSKILLLRSGKERLDLRDKKDIRNEIINLLGYSPELFKNSIIFGQKMKRIIEEDGPIKKKIFDDIFDIHYLKVAKEKSELKLADLKSEHNKVGLQLENSLGIIKGIRAELQNLKNIQLTQDTHHKSQVLANTKAKDETNGLIKELKGKILDIQNKKYNDKLLILTGKLGNLGKVLSKVKKTSDDKFKLELKIENVKGEYDNETVAQERLKAQYLSTPKICNSCGQKLTANNLQNIRRQIKSSISLSKSNQLIIKDSLIPLEEQLNRYNEFLEVNKGINDRICKINQLIALAQAELAKIGEYNNILEVHNKRLYELDRELINLNNSPKLVNLKQLRLRLKKEKSVKASLKAEKLYYTKQLRLTTWLIKDPLSNSGIKAFIFDNMLTLVNQKLTKYSSTVGFKINFGINLESANKDFYITISRGNQLRFYEDLSGGEQQLCNVCIAFALHDLVCIDKAANILILDEAFESLDQSNVEIISRLISEKSNGKAVHIITHQSDFNPTNSRIIRLINRGGNTETN